MSRPLPRFSPWFVLAFVSLTSGACGSKGVGPSGDGDGDVSGDGDLQGDGDGDGDAPGDGDGDLSGDGDGDLPGDGDGDASGGASSGGMGGAGAGGDGSGDGGTGGDSSGGAPSGGTGGEGSGGESSGGSGGDGTGGALGTGGSFPGGPTEGIVDVAVADGGIWGLDDVRRVCTLDDAGGLSCIMAHSALNLDWDLPLYDAGPYSSIAGMRTAICALAASGSVTCWGAAEPFATPGAFSPEARLGRIDSGTGACGETVAFPSDAEFLQDDGDALYLKGEDRFLYAALDHPLSFVEVLDVVDMDVQPGSTNEDVSTPYLDVQSVCVVGVDGRAGCFEEAPSFENCSLDRQFFDLDDSGAVLLPESDYIDIAGGKSAPVCGVHDSLQVTCNRQQPVPLPEFAQSIVAMDHATIFARLPNGRVYLADAGGNYEFLRTITPGVAPGYPVAIGDVYLPGLDSQNRYVAYFPNESGALDWWTPLTAPVPQSLDAGGVAMTRFVGRDVTLGFLDKQGRIWDPLAAPGAVLSETADLYAVGPAAFCGLDQGEFVCTGNAVAVVPPASKIESLRYSVQPGWSAAQGICAISTDGTLSCNSSQGLISDVPAGTFVDVSFRLAEPWEFLGQNTGISYAIGVRTDGTLACWGSAGVETICDALPTDGGYAKVWARGTNGFTLLRAADAAAFVSYSGRFAMRGDGTIADWVTPASPVPSGAFIKVVDNVAGVTGDVDGAQATGCGLRASGAVECWQSLSGVLTMIPIVGNYLNIAGGDGTLLLLDEDGATFVLGNRAGLAQSPVVDFLENGLWGCAIELDGSLNCREMRTIEEWITLPPSTGEYESLHHAHQFQAYCATPVSGSDVCFGNVGPLLLDTTGLRKIDHSSGVVCGITTDTSQVECRGTNNASAAGFTTHQPVPVAPSPVTDVALTPFLGCLLRSGELECWGNPWFGALPGGPFVEIVSGFSSFVFVRADGTLVGMDGFANPVEVPTGSFEHIRGSYSGFCGVTTAGEPVCWE